MSMKDKHWLFRLFLGLLLLCLLTPVVLTFLYSLCSVEEMAAFLSTRGRYNGKLMEMKWIPRQVSLSQYWDVMIRDEAYLRFYLNSMMYTAVILLGQIMIVPMTAYGLSRFRFRGKEVLSFLVIMLLLLPFQVTMVPTVLTLRNMELLNTPWAMILPSLAPPLYIFLLRQSMVSIPGELFEAAQIDGAGPIRCFVSVALPACRAMLGAFIALSFADLWNMVEQPLVFLPEKEQLHPLSVMFHELTEQDASSSFAGAFLYLLPALMIYLFFQQDIATGLQLSELK